MVFALWNMGWARAGAQPGHGVSSAGQAGRWRHLGERDQFGAAGGAGHEAGATGVNG